MRIGRIRSGLAGAAMALAACVSDGAAQPPAGQDAIGKLIEDSAGSGQWAGDLETYLGGLRRASCPGDAREAEEIGLGVSAVPLQGLNPGRKAVGELSYVAGFHLTSPDKRFGGLSGIDVLADGNLLAVSDTGVFVWLDLARDGVTPVKARLAAMNDAAGKPFPTKRAGDAEGLAVIGDMALASFEGDSRVLAYDVGKCGAAARGVALGWKMTTALARKTLPVNGNRGVEALAVTPDWYLFAGIEKKVGKTSPLSARPVEALPRFDLAVGPNAPEVVGLDLAPVGKDGQDVRAFSLHRSTSPLASNAIAIVETDFARELDQAKLPARVTSETDERSHYGFRQTASRTLAEMNLLLTIDNFEGIAAKELPDGRVRLFIVSDDNFSASQRTLLMVFDVAKRS
jgi:hypothetical protein